MPTRRISFESPEGLKRTNSKTYTTALNTTEVFITKLEAAFFLKDSSKIGFEQIAARVK
jgi:hypothetical protein